MITRLLEVPWERKKGGLGTTTRDSYCLLLLLFISPLCFLFTCKCWTGKESFSLFFFFTRIALEWKENCSGITRLFLKAEIPTAPIDRCNRYCFIHLSFYFRCNSFGHDPIRFCAHYVFFLFTNPLTQHTNKHKKNKTNKIRGVSCLAKNKKLGSSLPAIVNKLFGNVHVWHFWRAFNNRDCESFRSFRIHDSWKERKQKLGTQKQTWRCVKCPLAFSSAYTKNRENQVIWPPFLLLFVFGRTSDEPASLPVATKRWRGYRKKNKRIHPPPRDVEGERLRRRSRLKRNH